LGGDAHWTDADVGAGAATGDLADAATRRRQERQRRVAGLNRVLRAFGCTVSDWQGHAYLLGTFTGKTEIVADLAALWPAVQRLTGRDPDPLDAGLVERLGAAS
jgi:hypothetical protein